MITSFQSHLAYVLKLYKVVLIPESSDDDKYRRSLKIRKFFILMHYIFLFSVLKFIIFYFLPLFA